MNPIRVIIELILIVQFTKCSELTVNTSCGMLIGREFESRNGNIVAAFHGIPYAKPPIDGLRFQDPQPAEPWSGIREAYNFGSVCVQIPIHYPPVSTTKLGNEDCLYLSVYSSNLNPRSLLPVLVYIHGGPFYSGSGEIDKSPEFFMDNDLVVVMPNYRLGVLGFLTMEDDVMPGNLGLKDQNMALVWIQNNIANFGGDPNQVTLIGETSGAACVNYHMYSPMSKGLFHKAITQTGSALGLWANVPPGVARSRAINLAEMFNCPTESSKAILDCLRTKNAYELTELYTKVAKVIQIDPLIIIQPICDRNAANPFLPFNPYDAEPAPVPWIVGITSLAGLCRTGGSTDDDTIYIWNNKNPIEIPVPTTSQDLYISNLLIQLFYNFVSLGEPTPSGFKFDWPQWDNQEQNFISIENSGVTLNSSLLPDRMQFWAQLNLRDNECGNC